MIIGKHRELLGCHKNVCFSVTYWKYPTSTEWSNQNADIKPLECLWRDLKMSVHRCYTSNLMKLHWICQEGDKMFRCAKLYSGNIQNKTKQSTESKVLISFVLLQMLAFDGTGIQKNCPNYLITEEQESQEQHGGFLQKHLKNPCLTQCLKNNHAFNSSKPSPQGS